MTMRLTIYSLFIASLPRNRQFTRFNFASVSRARDFLLDRAGKNTWERFQPMIELALEANGTTLADVGTDHGLLAASLAFAGHFDRIIGSDISLNALEKGAFALEKQMRERSASLDTELLFEHGDGLSKSADVVCIAGMGIQTMLDILDREKIRNTQRIILQPTQSRPKHLIGLYQGLSGWSPVTERIACVSSKWYVTTAFEPSDESTTVALPIQRVDLNDPLLPGFLDHHCRWLSNDRQYSDLKGGEEAWLDYFLPVASELENRERN